MPKKTPKKPMPKPADVAPRPRHQVSIPGDLAKLTEKTSKKRD